MNGKKQSKNIKYTASIVIPVFNRAEYTRNCIASLQNTLPDGTEVIIVDNGSTDETGPYLSTLPPGFRVITNRVNTGFARACNQGARLAQSRYLVFLNNDTLALPNWLEEMVITAEKDHSIAVVGSRLLYPNGTLQHAGIIMAQSRQDPLIALHAFYKMPGDLPEANVPRDYQAVTGACMLVKREIFFEVGGFGEEYINGYEDVDLCLKVRQTGRRVVYCPTSVLYHYESVSEGRHSHIRHNSALLHKHWLGRIQPEYHYNAGRLLECRKPVSVLLATQNSMGTLRNCVRALLASTTPEDEIIIIDSCSKDGTREYLAGLKIRTPSVKIILNQESRGLPWAYKMGLAHCTKEYVGILKPEAVVGKNWLAALKHFKADDIGAVGPVTNKKAEKQWFPYQLDTSDCPGEITVEQLERLLREKNWGKAAETKLLDGLCSLMPKKVINELDLFETGDLLEKYELYWAYRLSQKGYKLLIARDSLVFCEQEAGSSSYQTQRSINLISGRLKKGHPPDRPPTPEEIWGISWFKPSGGLTSMVIPCLDQVEYTRQCVESIFENTPEPFELIFINNGSKDGTGQYLQKLAGKHKNISIISNPKNLGYGAACNQGMKSAGGRYVLLLNNDTVVTEGWLARMLAAGDCIEGVGIVGPRSNSVSGAQRIPSVPYRDLDGMRRFARERAVLNAARGFTTNRLIGFCMLVKKEVLDRIGGFDPCFGLGNFEDDDLCLRARIAGFKLWVCDDVFVHHYGSITFNGARLGHSRLMESNWEVFRKKWGLPDNCPYLDGYDMTSVISRPFDYKVHRCPI
ncbi:MAG TPA: hypothetical protein DEF36_12690 [Desulfotomaculum sp.]|nr:hypothetical protein [Desulfotomaculum sp.]